MTRILVADENGAVTIPADLLRGGPGARYVVETGSGDGLRMHVERSVPESSMTPEEWLAGWKELAERIGRASATNRTH